MILIELTEYDIERLIECRKMHAKQRRNFAGWSMKDLLNEAIIDFYDKYGKEEVE